MKNRTKDRQREKSDRIKGIQAHTSRNKKCEILKGLFRRREIARRAVGDTREDGKVWKARGDLEDERRREFLRKSVGEGR